MREVSNQEKLDPIVDEVPFELNAIGQAHDRLSSGQATGKVVFSVN